MHLPEGHVKTKVSGRGLEGARGERESAAGEKAVDVMGAGGDESRKTKVVGTYCDSDRRWRTCRCERSGRFSWRNGGWPTKYVACVLPAEGRSGDIPGEAPSRWEAGGKEAQIGWGSG